MTARGIPGPASGRALKGGNAGTVQVVVEGKHPLTERQRAEMNHAFRLHQLNVSASLAGYLVRHRTLSDGSKLRITSNNGQHTLYVEPVGGGGLVVIPRIYSGVIRDGEIVDVSDILYLRDFQPTQQCWEGPLARSPDVPVGEWSDIKQLAVDPNGGSTAGTSKYQDKQASMYSGLMAKVVQVVLGFGREEFDGLRNDVAFNYRWNDCHGVALGADGVAWLLWIKDTHGLVAMPLPLLANTSRLKAGEDVVQETVALFGGIPSGQGFPIALEAAITAGRVRRLLTASDLSDYFSKFPFSAQMGWSFNADGSEAHNVMVDQDGVVVSDGTIYQPSDRARWMSYHYRIDINIPAMPGDGTLPDCTASLTLVEEAEMRQMANGLCAFPCSDSDLGPGAVQAMPTIVNAANEPATGSFPVLACHIDGVLEVVRVETADNTQVHSDRFPAPTLVGSPTVTYAGQVGMWAAGARDAYIVVEAISSTNNLDGTSTYSDFIWNVVMPDGVVNTVIEPGPTGAGTWYLYGTSRDISQGSSEADYYDTFRAPVVNCSMLGANPQAVYSTQYRVKGATGYDQHQAEATGSMLADQPVIKPFDVDLDEYPWNTYAFAGYI